MRKNLRRCICMSLLSAMLTLSAACAQNTALYKNCRRHAFPISRKACLRQFSVTYLLFVTFYLFPAAVTAVLLLCYSHHCDMRIYALIPVQEALHIDGLANLQRLYRIIHIRRIVTQIRLYRKGIRLSILRSVKIQVVSV